MKELNEEINNARKYVEGKKEEFEKCEPTNQTKLRQIEKQIDKMEMYLMGLEFAKDHLESENN